ncbi:MAG: type II toxin-antitoxin system HicA family toxin [Deltaproteobacteria bacterium]|nr:type II toxin-antitoxin system HicA family toxin [Deltaproteobacteria bacterium]
MKIPRDISGEQLAKLLEKVGYRLTRQTGGHMRLTAAVSGEHHLTIPKHKPLKVGTLSGILRDVAQYLKISRDELIRRLLQGD